MTRRTPILTLMLCVLGSVAGCYTRASDRPFADEPTVEVEGLPLVVAGALSHSVLAVSDSFARLGGGEPRYLRFARILSDPEARPDELREALLGLTDYPYGRKPPYTEAYAQFAANAQNDLVRAAAVRALNISRDTSATGLFIEKLADSSVQVRLEAAKALANVPDESAVTPLMERATSAQEDLDVRIAAVDALRHYRSAELLRSLINLLAAEEFGVAWQARHSLVAITGEDHGFDSRGWLRAISGQ